MVDLQPNMYGSGLERNMKLKDGQSHMELDIASQDFNFFMEAVLGENSPK